MCTPYADAQAFLAPHGRPPLVPDGLHLELAVVTPCPPIVTEGPKILELVRAYRTSLEEQGVMVVTSQADLAKCRLSKGLGVVLSLQHPPEGPDFIEALHELWKEGVRMTTVAYKGKNQFGAGFTCPEVGLTNDGEALIHTLFNLGFVVDLAHASDETAKDVLAYAHNPNSVMISHAGVWEVYDHPRNVRREIIETLIRKLNGFFGLYTLSFGLDEADNSLTPIGRHLRELIEIDPDLNSIGWGTDGIYTEMDDEEISGLYDFLKRAIDADGTFRSRMPMESRRLTGPEKLAHLDDFVEGMLFQMTKRNADEARARVMGKNLFDFFARALPDE